MFVALYVRNILWMSFFCRNAAASEFFEQNMDPLIEEKGEHAGEHCLDRVKGQGGEPDQFGNLGCINMVEGQQNIVIGQAGAEHHARAPPLVLRI